MSNKLIAIEEFPYLNRTIKVGEEFEAASENDALLLTELKNPRAKRAGPKKKSPDELKREEEERALEAQRKRDEETRAADEARKVQEQSAGEYDTRADTAEDASASEPASGDNAAQRYRRRDMRARR